jgi:hypothetical protein
MSEKSLSVMHMCMKVIYLLFFFWKNITKNWDFCCEFYAKM